MALPSTPLVAVLHHDTSYSPIDLFQQVGGHHRILWVVDQNLSERQVMSRFLRRLGAVVDVADLGTTEAAARIAAHSPDGIITFVDDHIPTVAALATELGLAYHSPEVAGRLVNKYLQRSCLEAAGIPVPRHWLVPENCSAQSIRTISEEVSYPAVLKPVYGSGSYGICAIGDSATLLARLNQDSACGDHLVEEYLPDFQQEDPRFANYLSVESVVSSQQTSHVAITGRFPLAEPFRETGNFIPGLVPQEHLDSVLKLAGTTIDALGIKVGCVHTEIKLTPAGPRIIEVNGRLGGRPPFVLRSASDVNLFTAAFDVAIGRSVHFAQLAECRRVGYWFMIQPPTSAHTVLQINGVDTLSTVADVDSVRINKYPGDPVDWRLGTSSHVISVHGTTADHAALARLSEQIPNFVQITYG